MSLSVRVLPKKGKEVALAEKDIVILQRLSFSPWGSCPFILLNQGVKKILNLFFVGEGTFLCFVRR